MKLTSNHKIVVLGALIGAGVTLFTAVAVQQDYRLSANDPQIQLAADGAAALGRGTAPAAIAGDSSINAATSLAPFVMVFDSGHKVLATSGQFDGRTLTPPAGTFDHAQAQGSDRFTWQTATGVREAAVLVYQSGPHSGYVLAARSLAQVEQRENALTLMALATLAGIAVVAAAFLWFARSA